ncbi:hypothetical protein BKA62DRAFT_51601 [Auriculariales sp. MPI-PUGE-AT-0066]|nr:hypothetical protein BKA62DRAFT_51601 [Auriculariales sp. MPI-PUGE-AT-0066]
MLIKPIEAIPADNSNKLVILIDALDECSDVERLVGGAFLSSVINALPSMSGRVKLLLTSRREPRFRRVRFSMGAVAKRGEAARVHARADLRRHSCLPRAQFQRYSRQAQTSGNMAVSHGCRRARSKVRCILHLRCHTCATYRTSQAFPSEALGNILAKAGAEGLQRKGLLTRRWMICIWKSFCLFAGPEDEPGHTDLCDHVRQIVAAVVLGLRPMSVAMISSILGLELEDVRTVVRGLGALWIVPATDDIPISLFHESFPDFILNTRRCADARFRLSPDIGHCQIARGCLGVMNDLLKENICQIEYLPGKPLPSRDQIPDLNERLDLHVPAHLKYSVEHWIDHFRSVQNIEGLTILSDVAAPFSKFCDEKLLYWIETLSLLDQNGVRRLILNIAQPLHILQAAYALIASGRLLQEFLVAVQNFEEPLRRSHAEIYSFFLAFLPDGELFSQVFRTPSPDSSLDQPRFMLCHLLCTSASRCMEFRKYA